MRVDFCEANKRLSNWNQPYEVNRMSSHHAVQPEDAQSLMDSRDGED